MFSVELRSTAKRRPNRICSFFIDFEHFFFLFFFFLTENKNSPYDAILRNILSFDNYNSYIKLKKDLDFDNFEKICVYLLYR